MVVSANRLGVQCHELSLLFYPCLSLEVDAGGSLLKTGEVAKKIVGGAADVPGNITGEIKQGIGAK
jgi:hypothetical protein